MRYNVTSISVSRGLVARSLQALALCLATSSVAFADQPKAPPQCAQVGGSVMTNFISQETTLGPATGDLQGAVSADLLGVTFGSDGTAVFSVQHHWTTDAGDTIAMQVAQASATQVLPGLFAVTSYPVTIQGGTGRFAGATGLLRNIGEVDLNSQRTVFRYSGYVCFKGAAK